MKNLSPSKVALLASGGVSLLLLFFLLALKALFPSIFELQVLIIVPVAAFITAWALIFFLMERFIYSKIKNIYETIYRLRAPKNGIASMSAKEMMKHNVIGKAETEVMEWSDSQKKEIETLKDLANYRKEFVSDVSHELKTPIFNIQGYLHTLIDGGMDDPSINLNYLNKASENLERLSNIVADLEVISQIESNSLILDLTRFDIVKLIKDVLDDLEMKADAKEITLQMQEGADQTIFVVADRERIRQVLVNLVANSIRYGKERGTTTAAVYDRQDHVAVEVADDGIGIAKEHLPRLFERFYRVDKSRSRQSGGTGLGLSIAKHIIEAHEQAINVRSTPGVGSTFGFTLKKG